MRPIYAMAAIACMFLTAIGCGKDEVVKVDNGSGQDGVLRRDIDKAKDVGAQESSYQKSGESVAYGDSK